MARTARPVPQPAVDIDGLEMRAGARWAAITGDRPDLAPAIAVQRGLVGGVFDAMRAIARLQVPAPGTVASLTEKMTRGLPAFEGESIPLPLPVLAPLLRQFCEHLGRGAAGRAARHLADVLDSERLDAGSLLAASLARDQCGVKTTATCMGLSADLVWLAAEFSVGPYAHALERAWTRALCATATTHPLPAAAWDRGYCPVCGSWPVYAEIVAAQTSLRCCFCAHAWQLTSHRCVYCAEPGTLQVKLTPDPTRPDRWLELCSRCSGYLKAVTLLEPTPFPLMAIEDLATADLDVAAQHRGHVRPPLRQPVEVWE